MAAERFALGELSSAIAREIRVSVRSVQRWRRTWSSEQRFSSSNVQVIGAGVSR
ncbi:hypothetical protein [Streptomyces sp. NPDC050564]|uniref:hypothetical protein n=1 Tax=Streptomyces sp. NPDC050564 TaxID=3365631 RepID=UPI0037B700FD